MLYGWVHVQGKLEGAASGCAGVGVVRFLLPAAAGSAAAAAGGRVGSITCSSKGEFVHCMGLDSGSVPGLWWVSCMPASVLHSCEQLRLVVY